MAKEESFRIPIGTDWTGRVVSALVRPKCDLDLHWHFVNFGERERAKECTTSKSICQRATKGD